MTRVDDFPDPRIELRLRSMADEAWEAGGRSLPYAATEFTDVEVFDGSDVLTVTEWHGGHWTQDQVDVLLAHAGWRVEANAHPWSWDIEDEDPDTCTERVHATYPVTRLRSTT